MFVFWNPCARAELHQQKRAQKLCSATLVKRRVIVDDSRFSPNYHQLSPTIIQVVKRLKKFMIVDDSSPAVAQAKSREQRVPSSFRYHGPFDRKHDSQW